MYLGLANKLRLQNDVQTEGRPRPPPGNAVITIITYRALILISPSNISFPCRFRPHRRSFAFLRESYFFTTFHANLSTQIYWFMYIYIHTFLYLQHFSAFMTDISTPQHPFHVNVLVVYFFMVHFTLYNIVKYYFLNIY